MKILQWIFPFVSTQGGRENFVLNLAEDFQQIGDQVRVIGFDPAQPSASLSEFDHDGWPVSVLGLAQMLAGQPGIMQRLLAELEALVADFRPDVIHNHNPEGPDLLLLRAVAKKYEIPVVTTIHGPLMTPTAAAQSKVRLVSELSSRVVAISETSRDETLRHYPGLSGRLDLVVNGVLDAPIPAAKPQASSQIFASGRFSPEKGFAQLLAALALVRKVIPDVKLVLAGSGPDVQILPKYAEVLGVSESVRFTGWLTREQARAELAKASVVVVPSVWEEPFGLVAVEAMLAEKPVIAARSGELAKIVHHEATGLLFDSGDVIDLAAKIRLLLEDSQRATSFGKAGRLRALERYSQRRCTLQYRNLYLAVQNLPQNFSLAELNDIGSGGNWRVFPQDLGVVLQDADRLAGIAEFKSGSRVPPIFKMTHDDTTPLPAAVTEGAAVFRTSMMAGQSYRNEYPLPVLIDGHVFDEWEPVAAQPIPTVGFVGHAAVGSYHKAISKRAEEDVQHVGYGLIESTNSLLRTPVNIGLILRKKAMGVLETSTRVATDFVVRDRYHHNDAHASVNARSEFLENLRKNPYSLCIRGVGNFSIRLYETLAAGRIPVILNTSLVLPLDHLIDWKNLGVWVEVNQLDAIDEAIAEFHGALSPGEFRDKQLEIRETWWRYLSQGTFWRHATELLNQRGLL